MDNPNSKMFTIVGGNLEAHKAVIAWIKQCVAEQSMQKFKDVSLSHVLRDYTELRN